MSERRGIAGHGVRSGTLTGGLPYLAQGSGPPLVVLAGLGKDNALPHGLQRRFELGTVRPYADAGRTAYWVTRRPGLAAGVTMADLAADHAVALRADFGEPVDVLGFSTGGSVAQQLALDHPDVVRRLVLACTAYRLGTAGRATQRRLAELAAAGHRRAAARVSFAVLGGSTVSRVGWGLLGWLVGPLVVARDPTDLIATILAEDAFDVRARLGEVRAPTLVIGGDRDAFYDQGRLIAETAHLIPGGRLVLYAGKGHGAAMRDRRLPRDVLGFVQAAS